MTRITIDLDDELWVSLEAEARETGLSAPDIVTRLLRRTFVTQVARTGRAPFRVQARDLGEMSGGSCIGRLIDDVEGPAPR